VVRQDSDCGRDGREASLLKESVPTQLYRRVWVAAVNAAAAHLSLGRDMPYEAPGTPAARYHLEADGRR
jgi:hypothetical protein